MLLNILKSLLFTVTLLLIIIGILVSSYLIFFILCGVAVIGVFIVTYKLTKYRQEF